MLLTLLACGEPDPFADTSCSHHWPVDIAGAEWRYTPVADGEYGAEGWRTVRTAGEQEWQSGAAFLLEFSAELDFETVDSYRINGREAWTCDADGSWFLGREQSTDWVDGDSEGTDSYALILDEPVLLVPSAPTPGDSWDGEAQASVDLGTTGQLEGAWQVSSSVSDEGVHEDAATIRIDRAVTFQSQTDTYALWFGDGVGETLDEGRWELLDLTW